MSQSNEPLIYNGAFYLHRVVCQSVIRSINLCVRLFVYLIEGTFMYNFITKRVKNKFSNKSGVVNNNSENPRSLFPTISSPLNLDLLRIQSTWPVFLFNAPNILFGDTRFRPLRHPKSLFLPRTPSRERVLSPIHFQ